jgi:hypothetical protein
VKHSRKKEIAMTGKVERTDASRWLDKLIEGSDNPIRPEDFQAACGPGHRVVLDMGTKVVGAWSGEEVTCQNCQQTIAFWQDWANYKDKSGPVKKKPGYIVTPEGGAPCPTPALSG